MVVTGSGHHQHCPGLHAPMAGNTLSLWPTARSLVACSQAGRTESINSFDFFYLFPFPSGSSPLFSPSISLPSLSFSLSPSLLPVCSVHLADTGLFLPLHSVQCVMVYICGLVPPHPDSLPNGSIQPPPHLSPEAHPHPLCYCGNTLCYTLRIHCLIP